MPRRQKSNQISVQSRNQRVFSLQGPTATQLTESIWCPEQRRKLCPTNSLHHSGLNPMHALMLALLVVDDGCSTAANPCPRDVALFVRLSRMLSLPPWTPYLFVLCLNPHCAGEVEGIGVATWLRPICVSTAPAGILPPFQRMSRYNHRRPLFTTKALDDWSLFIRSSIFAHDLIELKKLSQRGILTMDELLELTMAADFPQAAPLFSHQFDALIIEAFRQKARHTIGHLMNCHGSSFEGVLMEHGSEIWWQLLREGGNDDQLFDFGFVRWCLDVLPAAFIQKRLDINGYVKSAVVDPMVAAITTSDYQLMIKLLDLGYRYHTVENTVKWSASKPALYAAIQRKDFTAVTILLDSGGDPSVNYVYGANPLGAACESGVVEIVRLLLTCGKKLDVNEFHYDRHTALTTALSSRWTVSLELVQLLLDHGADPTVSCGCAPQLFSVSDLARATGRSDIIQAIQKAVAADGMIEGGAGS